MIHRVNIIHASQPLHRIVWGALLVLFDVTFTWTAGGEGFRLDIVSDTVGLMLITAAVGRLRDISTDASYVNRMRAIHWVSILVLLESLMQHFIFNTPEWLKLLSSALGLATILAVLCFCACMRDLCREVMLDDAARAWRRTIALFLFCYGIPCGALVIVGLASTMTGQPPHLDLGPGILWLGALFLVSLVSFFSATATMARSAEKMSNFTLEAAALVRASALQRR